MTAGTLETKLSANTSGFQASMTAAAAATERESKRMQSMISAVSKFIKEQEAATKHMATSAQTDMGSAARAAEKLQSAHTGAAHAAEKMQGAHAGASRELLVLAHEMSQGNYSKFGGSMLVLAEQTNALSFALTGAGAATLGLGAAAIAAVAGIALGAIEAEKFGRALQLTGNYAAVTEESITQMAKAQARLTGQGIAGARGSLESVAGSGLFSPAALATAARALGDYQRVTKSTEEEALKHFEAIKGGVAKWAEEENRSVHFINAAQFEYIKHLEETGQAERAEIEALNAWAQAIESRGVPALSAFSRAWQGLKESIESVGRPVDPLTSAIAAVEREQQGVFAQQARARQARGINPQGGEEYLQGLDAERARLERLQFRANEHRADASTNAAIANAAIAAREDIDALVKKAHATSALTEALHKYHEELKSAAAGGVPVSAADAAAGEAEIRKSFAHSFAGVASPNSAQEVFRTAEIAKNEQVIEAMRAASLKELEAQNELMSHIHELDDAQMTFRRSELETAEGVNKALRDQQLIQADLAHQAAHDSSFTNGWNEATADYMKQAANAAAFGRKVFEDATQGMTDALTQFATTGKLSFKGLIDSMISDLIRFEVQKGIAAVFGGGGGSGAGAAGSAAGSIDWGNLGQYFGVSFANGLDYVPYDGFRAVLHEGEKVTRKQDAANDRSRGGQAIQLHTTVNVGPGVDRAEVTARVQTGMAQVEARMKRLLQTGKVVA